MPPVHWKSPDGAVERTLLPNPSSDGSGDVSDFTPSQLCQPGARCTLHTELDPDSPPPAGLDLSDPAVSAWLPAGRATVGEAETEVDRLLDRCLRTVREGDRCRVKLRLRSDRLSASASAAVSETTTTNDKDCQRPAGEIVLTLTLTVLEVSGGQPDAQLTASERLAVAESARLRGNELFSSGRDVDAFHRYRRALSLLSYILPPDLPESSRPAVATAQTACRANLSAVLLRRGRHEAARAAAARVLAEKPDHVRCLYRRGAASLALQDHEEAERDLKRVLELDPGNAAAARQVKLLERRKRDVDQHTASFMNKYFQQ